MSRLPTRPKTYVYIDGFNLYYGCFRRGAPPHWARYKWLDLEKLCDSLLPRNDVVAIRYYTADVSNRPADNRQSDRQQAYLRALSTLPRVQIVKGRFLGPKVVSMPLCDVRGRPEGRMVRVLRTEEKGSDVNLAVDLLFDCVRNLYQCAVIVSNDSGLAGAIRIVRDHYQKTIGIVNPQRGRPSLQLSRLADFHIRISEKVLSSSQFPAEVAIGARVVRKPGEWC